MRIIAVLFALALPLLACAEAEPVKPAFEEGVHYTVISGQPAPAKTGKIKITEMFWYGCSHCFKFEPSIAEWKKTLADDVVFEQLPAMWRANMKTHAELFFTAKSLGQLEQLHPVFFDAMNVKRKKMVDDSEIAQVVTSAGLDGKAFVSTMKSSFALAAQVEGAQKRAKAYGMTGTPEIVVADYYHLSAKKAGSQQKMLEVADFLVKKIRSER